MLWGLALAWLSRSCKAPVRGRGPLVVGMAVIDRVTPMKIKMGVTDGCF